jgi:hypothetical protein
MTTTTFLQLVNDAYRGTDDVAPIIGTDDANYWLRTASRIKRNLYSTAGLQWNSTYQVLNLGTISVNAAPAFDLDDTFIGPAESCYVIDLQGSRHDFPIIVAQEQDYGKQAVFIAGQDPEQLFFTQAITAADGYIGGTLYLPAYVMPDDINTTSGTATVVVDDPDWLVVATAAKLAFNDITYEAKAADLNNEANALYRQMVQTNRRGTTTNPRRSRTQVVKIGQRHATRFS